MLDKNVILASKLYKGCTDRTRILSALESPINSELLQQPLEDIEAPETAKSVAEETAKAETAETAKSSTEEAPAEDTKSSGMNIKNITSEPKPVKFKAVEKTETEDDAGKETEVTETETEVTEEPKDTDSATKLIGTAIKASTMVEYVTENADIIKNSLNNIADTAGVVSYLIKDNDGAPELWLYYNDEVNLNDMIYSVVSLFNSTGYNMLRFNRLARSNNAIVFDILSFTEPVKSISELSDEE